MSDVFNVFDAHEWDAQNEREGFRHLRVAIGERLGGRLLGATLYELPPGERTWPYHYERGCEEWLVVVAGTPVLRAPDGERELKPGDIVVFPEGPDGAHQVGNRSSEPCRVLVLSTKAPVAIVHYPDSGKVALWSSEGGRTIIRDEPEVDYWEGEA